MLLMRMLHTVKDDILRLQLADLAYRLPCRNYRHHYGKCHSQGDASPIDGEGKVDSVILKRRYVTAHRVEDALAYDASDNAGDQGVHDAFEKHDALHLALGRTLAQERSEHRKALRDDQFEDAADDQRAYDNYDCEHAADRHVQRGHIAEHRHRVHNGCLHCGVLFVKFLHRIFNLVIGGVLAGLRGNDLGVHHVVRAVRAGLFIHPLVRNHDAVAFLRVGVQQSVRNRDTAHLEFHRNSVDIHGKRIAYAQVIFLCGPLRDHAGGFVRIFELTAHHLQIEALPTVQGYIR